MMFLIPSLAFALALISSIWFVRRRLLRYLHFLQQEEYDCGRFLSWLWRCRAFDKRGSSIASAALFFLWIADSGDMITFSLVYLTASVALWIISLREKDPRKEGKVPLRMTDRATRIYRCALATYGVSTLFFLFLMPFWMAQLFAFQSIPLYLVVSVLLLRREENRRQRRLVSEAKVLLGLVQPYVIGITGSYGKTSTKDALGQILQVALGATFWPSKSINTLMGNTREIRTNLRKGHRYAIFEMGAYGRGSIARLCGLTPPRAAIVTAVGMAHLERFISEENIYLAKSELAQALPDDGILVCNGDSRGARRISEEYPVSKRLLYGFDPSHGNLDCHITSWQTMRRGTSFSIDWQGKSYHGMTPLFGKPNLSNVAAAFCMACALGAHPEYVLATISTLEPVNNRLQVTMREGITFLHDAYNSNPIGFMAALEVMQNLPGERRILITPGMIELGAVQDAENERLGQVAASICDCVIVVGSVNKKALLSGLQKSGLSPEKIIVSPTRDQALQQLHILQRKGDIVLIENDLTDLYEGSTAF